MALIALGINHKSATLALRERVAFVPEQMTDALQQALQSSPLEEVVILSTCNRTELFGVLPDHGVTEQQAVQQVSSWLAQYHSVALVDVATCIYSHFGQQALRHLIEVASGLDSMVLGEPQIFGQIKSAYSDACDADAVGAELMRVFPHVFTVAKRVRTDTAIGENPVSVAFAAVSLAQHIFADLSQSRALLVGAGDTIELVARHLTEAGLKDVVVANRTLGRAQELAQRFDGQAVLLADIPQQLTTSDIVITSTASQLPILGKGAVEQAMKRRKHRPILMVDIAVPRDIEEQVGELDDIYLYTVDDLTEIIDENKRNRESEARKADVIIEQGLEEFQQNQRALDGVEALKRYRGQAEQTRDTELEKALRLLQRGEQAEQVMQQLARNLTNKLIHHPSIEMKKASAEGRAELLDWAQTLLGLTQVDRPQNDEDESS